MGNNVSNDKVESFKLTLLDLFRIEGGYLKEEGEGQGAVGITESVVFANPSTFFPHAGLSMRLTSKGKAELGLKLGGAFVAGMNGIFAGVEFDPRINLDTGEIKVGAQAQIAGVIPGLAMLLILSGGPTDITDPSAGFMIGASIAGSFRMQFGKY